MSSEKSAALLHHFVCPITKSPLTLTDGVLISLEGRRYPVRNGVPRFAKCGVNTKSYSYLTKKIPASHRDHQFVEWRFTSLTGLTPREVEGKLILDVGLGSGHYSEVLAHWGATVIGIDSSDVVESAAKHLAGFESAIVAQADLHALPFRENTFDFIVATDTLNHTAAPRAAFTGLIPVLKTGGSISVWVPEDSTANRNRAAWTPFTSFVPHALLYTWCEWFISVVRRHKASDTVRWLHRVFPFADRSVGAAQDLMETFEMFSAKYNFSFSETQIQKWFLEAGLRLATPGSDLPVAVRGVK